MNTKQKKITAVCLFTIFIILTTFIFALPTEAKMGKTNIALECEIDSFCCEAGENKAASMLVDCDPDYETKWETSDGASHPDESHWIILDFGERKSFDAIKLVKASQGSEDFGRTDLDAVGFRFEVGSDKITWVKIGEITDDGDNDVYEGNFTPVTARYLKLTVNRSEQNENQAVRFYDLKVFECMPPVLDYDYEHETVDIFGNASEQRQTDKINPETSDTALPVIIYIICTAVFAIPAGVFAFAKKTAETVI